MRKPRPIGPAMPPALDGSGETVRYSPAVPAGGDGRRHVVEEAAVLVVVHDEHGLRPHLGVGDEDVQDLLHQVLAPLRRRGRVLALGQRRDDPGDAGQRAALHVGLEVAGVGRGDALGDQLEAGEAERVGVVLEVRQHAEAEDAGRVVVDLPADTPALSSASGIVSQFSLPVIASRLEAVVMTGPPAAPAGSIQAEIAISRFGSVGPSTEQW